MVEEDPPKPPIELIDEQATFTLCELCRVCTVEAKVIEALIEQGILEPAGQRRRHWRFPASSLRRTRISLHLQRNLGVNLASAALALDLLDRIAELEARSLVHLGGPPR